MKNLIILFLLITAFAKAQTLKGDEIIGTWLVGNSKAKIQITKTGDKFNGKIVWLKDPIDANGKAKLDTKNPDKAKRTNPILGMDLLNGFTFNKKDEWNGGTIYDAESGKTYSCKINYRDGKLDVRGYMGISLIGRTDTWFKTADLK
jgi:uncharacterized protein (DUF2147 family)